MSIWFKRLNGMNSQTMREIANMAGVTWEAGAVIYQANKIGYKNGQEDDVTALQDASETVIGYRLIQTDQPQNID